jgi:hypothetical protein
VQIPRVALEIDDRIPNELAGTMEGHVATTLHLEQLDATRREERGRGEKVRCFRCASQRDDRRMLHEEKKVLGLRPFDASTSDCTLQLERFSVRHHTQVDHLE